MKELTLTDYLESHSQAELAGALGVTAGAVHQWVKAQRDVRVVLHDDDSVSAYHFKPLGKAS